MSYQLTIEPTGDEVEVEEGQNMLDACIPLLVRERRLGCS